jgi:hypothetical protein
MILKEQEPSAAVDNECPPIEGTKRLRLVVLESYPNRRYMTLANGSWGRGVGLRILL